MSTPQPLSPANVGRGTGFVLGLVVFICMVMIGAAGFVKYQLDRAQSVLAAPGSAFVNDQETFEKLRRAFGYSGFVGYAQNFAKTHDANILPDMRAQVKQADQMIQHMPDKTPPEMRHDLQSILTVFQNAVDKAEKDSANFGPADMASLYAALPVLDSRVEGAVASNRLEAQEKLQFWSMLLTLVSWCSLIIASALAVGIYLVLRERSSAPMRALAQSVRNMARGDMRSSIWGMERTDMIGDLARAVDLARYHFSQLPDMSVMSEQGPVRLKFEGNTRSLFEAMMRVISRDSEQVRGHAEVLATAIAKQQETIDLISSRVEAVLHTVEKRAVDGDQHARQALQGVMSSAQSLKTAQEHAADQLSRLVPFMQERAHGMAEITQITGRQVAQLLSSLTLSERGLKASADQSSEAIKKMFSAADDLGERMFGAVNLLQASGKVLAETTDKTQSRLNEAIDIISTGGVPIAAAGSMPDMTPRLDAIVAAIEAMQNTVQATQKKLDEMPATSAYVPPSVSGASIPDIVPRLEALAVALEAAQKKLDEQVQNSPKPSLDADSEIEMRESDIVSSFAGEIKAGFENTMQQIEKLREQVMASAVVPVTAETTLPNSLNDQMRDHWYQMAAQIEATRGALEQTIMQQVQRIEERLGALGNGTPQQIDPAAFAASQQQMEQQSHILSELIGTLGVLDTHMQQLKTELAQHKAS